MHPFAPSTSSGWQSRLRRAALACACLLVPLFPSQATDSLPFVNRKIVVKLVFGGFAPATPGFNAFGQTNRVSRGGRNRPMSPHSRRRSGRIPALPYPLRERFDFSEVVVI
jgi:hypothetical protein